MTYLTDGRLQTVQFDRKFISRFDFYHHQKSFNKILFAFDSDRNQSILNRFDVALAYITWKQAELHCETTVITLNFRGWAQILYRILSIQQAEFHVKGKHINESTRWKQKQNYPKKIRETNSLRALSIEVHTYDNNQLCI